MAHLMFFLMALTSPVSGEWPWPREGRHPAFFQSELKKTSPALPEIKTSTLVMTGAFHFYRIVISPADGGRCDFYPTCSLYAFRAIQKYGLPKGVALAAERLMRDHGEAPAYSIYLGAGPPRLFDPVEANVFWQGPSWPWFSSWPPRPPAKHRMAKKRRKRPRPLNSP